VTRDGLNLIPQRLRLHPQALTGHHPHLALEWQVIDVLRDRDPDAKCRGISASREHLGRPRGRHDRAITAAPILLAHVVLDLIRELDRGNPLGVLRLPRHLRQVTAAGGTLPIIRRELMTNLDDRQRRLRTWPMPRVRRPRRTRGRITRGHRVTLK
jgi:hypothetical protein